MNHTIKITGIIRETEEAVTIQLENHKSLRGYTAGQFINVFQHIGNETISRSYSFSSSPATDPQPAITVKKVPAGRLSPALVDGLKRGQLLEVSEPAGRFSLNEENLEGKHLIFIAGGSGITPLFSMLKTALRRSQKVRITLLYANRTASSVIFLQQLTALQREHADRLVVVHFLTEGRFDQDIPYIQQGYLTKDFLGEVLRSYRNLLPEIYLCGPTPMMDTVSAYLEELRVEPGAIYRESFGLAKDDTAAGESGNLKTSEITFIKDGQSYQLTLSESDFILQSGLAAGLPLPHSCKEAMCGTCKVKVLTGKVSMTENYALTDGQLKDGYVLLCSGKPASGRIELKY